MTNILSLFLVVSSLVGAGLFSPNLGSFSSSNHQKENQPTKELIIKDGDRVIMVEYERQMPRTTTNSQQQQPEDHSALEEKLLKERELVGGIAGITKDKVKEAGEYLPNIRQRFTKQLEDHEKWHPRELICDAFGKCKHRLAEAFSQAKGKASETAQIVEEEAKEAGDAVKQKVRKAEEEAKQGGEAAKESAKEITQKVKGGVKETGEATKQRAREITQKVEERAEETGEAVKQKAQKMAYQVEEGAKETVDAVKQGAHEISQKAKEAAKEKGEAAKQRAQEITRTTKGRVTETGEATKRSTHRIAEDLKVAHHAIWDERSMQQKASGLIKEAGMNFSALCQKGLKAAHGITMQAASPTYMNPVMGIIHLLGFATAFGGSIWVTFVSSHVLAGALPRHQLGMVQSKIYPVYFKIMVGSVGSTLVTHCLINRNARKVDTFQMYNMLLSLLLVLFNLLYLEPRATKVMFSRMKMEKEEGRGRRTEDELGVAGGGAAARREETEEQVREEEEEEERRSKMEDLNKRLKKLNRVSSVLNVLSLMGLNWHLVYLAHRLHAATT